MSGRTEASSGPLPPLRWFGADDVVASMPPLEERLDLAERTLVALATPGASELPPKIAIHPRPDGSFVHAMPAHLRGGAPADDLVGMKWVAGFTTNNSRGLAAINAVVVLNDPETGVPVAMLDGGPITAQRTAAVTGLAIRRFGPSPSARARVAILGAGVQGASHLAVVGGVLPGATLHLFDRHGDRAGALAIMARGTAGIANAIVHDSARAAVAGANVVITAASFAPAADRQALTNGWLASDATVVAVDYATYVAAEVARDAALFLVDHREQFLANRDAGHFDMYPDPPASIGQAILEGRSRPAEGRVLVTHLGVGLADLVFADAIVRTATRAGRGTTLPR